MLIKIRNQFKKVAAELAHDELRLHAAQAAFFIITSIFPFLVIVLSIIGITGFSEQELIHVINNYMPKRVANILTDYIIDFYANQNAALLIVNIVSGLWISSLAFQAFKEGFDRINHNEDKHNFIVDRLIGGLFSILFTLAIFATLILYIFGKKSADHLSDSFPWASTIIITIFNQRHIIITLTFTLFFTIFFRILQGKKGSVIRELPGATLASLGLILFSTLYSKSWDYSMNMSLIYGSITNIAFAMLWLYFCIYIMLLGAEFNKLIRYLRNRHKNARN